MPSPRTFRSDNNAGICPEALAAINDVARAGHAVGYGDDEWTRDAVDAFHGVVGGDAAVFFVATGTIANTLAVASLTRPWQRVLCHEHSHWNDDESTAPERFTGCRTTAIAMGERWTSKVTPRDVEHAASNSRGDVHQPGPGALTVSNPTEFGEVYTPEEMRALCEAAHALGFRVHVDGARFANAVAALGCSARAISGDAGVDALSFGGTKNGLAFGEAVVFFPQGDGAWFERARADFPFLRKSAGALLSKHRFVSAPFAATLRSGAWLRHASHANRLASSLHAGLCEAAFEVRFPTEASAVFPTLADRAHGALQAKGHRYYMFGDPSWRLARLMCSFDTSEEDVRAFIADAAEAQGR